MNYLYTAKQAKQLDEHAINEIGFPGLVLMEKAAMTLAALLMDREEPQTGILFVCGTGNNGGDGLAAARLLHQQGYRTAVTMIGTAEKLSGDARKQLELAAACDVPVVSSEMIGAPLYPVLVDGLFGVGLARDITGVYEKIIENINHSSKRVYAIDIPSGIHGDDGRIMNIAVRADVTVTFGVNKRGLVLYPGCEYAGEVIVGDIGYPKVSYDSIRNPAYYYEPDDRKCILPGRRPDGHKGTFGHVSVIGGSPGMCGAAVFSAKAAYASGTGLVKVFSADENRNTILSLAPECLFSSYGDSREEIETALDNAISFADCIVVGPGLGTDERAQTIVKYVISHSERPVVLDGDGITLCQKEWLHGHSDIILTPHPKEFAAIFGKDLTEIKSTLVESAYSFAKDYNCVLAAKDARTIVSDGREIYINVSGNSGMGTGGSGDVLTGIVAAFCAQGAASFAAAKAGVYIHGLAGDYFAQNYNEYSLTATDLLESLKFVLSI